MEQNSILLIAGAFISGLIWLVRLEGRINQHEKDLVKLDNTQQNFDKSIVKQLTKLQESVARIEGALGVKHQD